MRNGERWSPTAFCDYDPVKKKGRYQIEFPEAGVRETSRTGMGADCDEFRAAIGGWTSAGRISNSS